METRLVGESERAIERAREEHRLMTEAKSAGIPVTEELTAQISAMADAYGEVSEELERAKERQEEWEDRIEFAKETTGNFLIDTKNNLKETGDLWGSMADAADNALDRTMDRMLNAVNDQVWSLLSEQLLGLLGGGLGLGGGATGGSWGKGLWGSAIFNAKGNAFASSDALSSMSNTVQNTPTIFPFAQGGGIGVLGEDPGSPGEAIMPLLRSPDGSLGVRAAGGGGDVPEINMYFYGGSSENRAEATRRDDGGIDVRAWLISEVTQEASKRGTPLNNLFRNSGGNQLTGRG
jgi:phage-related minor tail protein